MRILSEFPVVLSIWTLLRLQILLYSHLNQRQHLDDDVHRLLYLCYSLGMFLSLFRCFDSSLIINHDFNSFT